MNLGEILDFINFICSKAKIGYSYTDQDYNLNLPIIQERVYRNELPNYEKNQELSIAFSGQQVVMGDTTMPMMIDANGHGNVPSDFFYCSSMVYKYNTIGGTSIRPVTILTDSAFNKRLSSYILIATLDYPVATLRNGFYEFMPKGLGMVDFIYLKKPVKPIYDYYVNVDGESVFMPAGTSHPLATGEVYSDGTTITGTVHSRTVEISQDTYIQFRIIVGLLEMAGLHLSFSDVIQYSQLLKKENG